MFSLIYLWVLLTLTSFWQKRHELADFLSFFSFLQILCWTLIFFRIMFCLGEFKLPLLFCRGSSFDCYTSFLVQFAFSPIICLPFTKKFKALWKQNLTCPWCYREKQGAGWMYSCLKDSLYLKRFTFFFFLASLLSLQDLSSPTKDWTWTLDSESTES